jgi:hypothetical protein
MPLPAFVGLLSAAAPYIGSLLGLDGGDPSLAPNKPSPFMQNLNAQLRPQEGPLPATGIGPGMPVDTDGSYPQGQPTLAAIRANQSFLSMPPDIGSNHLDPSQLNWVNPDTGQSASQRNMATPPPVPSYEDFLKQYHSQALWNAIGKGPGQALGAIFGGVDAGAPAAYAELQRGAQQTESGRLGLAMPSLIGGLIDDVRTGKRDANFNLLQPQTQQSPGGMPQQMPQGMPIQGAAPQMPLGAMAPPQGMPQGAPGQTGPLAPPATPFPAGGVPPQPAAATQAPGNGVAGLLSAPPGMTPLSAMIMRMTDPVRYKAIVDGQAAPIRGGSYGPADASGNRSLFAPTEPGNPFQPNDPRWLQMQRLIDSQKAVVQNSARAAADKDITGFTQGNANRLEFGNLGYGGAPAGGIGSGRGPIPVAAPGPAGAMPQAAGTPGGAMPAGPGPIKTPQGTASPSLAEQPPIPQDAASLKAAIPDWQKKDAEMTSMPMIVQEPMQRLQTIADMFKLTETGQWATGKAQLGAMAKAAGISLPEGWTGDVTAVQTALHENSVKTLQTLKATTSRFTQLEFKTLAGNTEHPDLQPGANLQQLAEDVGTLQQQAALGKDWNTVGKMTGWRNPMAYEAAWSQHNPLPQFVAAAKDKIGPLKGMPGGPTDVPPTIDPAAARAELQRRGVTMP